MNSVQVFIVALSRTNNTKLNGSVIDNESQVQLFHEDQFTIGDRHFRWEYPTGSRLFQVKRPAPASSPVKTPAASADVEQSPVLFVFDWQSPVLFVFGPRERV